MIFTKNLKSAKHSPKGFILITSYLLFTVIAILSIALFARGSVFMQTAEHNRKKIVAFNMAEAGFDDAYARLASNTINAFPWNSGYVSMDSGDMQGGYQAAVTDVGNNIRKIQITGFSPDNAQTSPIQESRTVEGYVEIKPLEQPPFIYAGFGGQKVTVAGSMVVDSYKSNWGNYGAGGNLFKNANIATDSIDPATVTFAGSAKLNGGFIVGPGGVPGQVIWRGGTASYTTLPKVANKLYAPPLKTTSTPSEGALNLIAGTYQLTPGVHRFTSINVSLNAQIKALGPVQIYVDGDVTFQNSAVVAGPTNLPADVIILGAPNTKINVIGDSRVYAAIYSPEGTVLVAGNSTLYGAAVGKEINYSGNTAKVHYDEALKNVTLGSQAGGLKMKSWYEKDKAAQ